jgi:hypothetical protein
VQVPKNVIYPKNKNDADFACVVLILSK